MKIEHTPGPWELTVDPCHYDTMTSIHGGPAEIRGKGIEWRQMMVEVGGYADPSTAEANARLIAAAPDMLEALDRVFVAATRIGRGDVGDIGVAVETIRQTAAGAIAKALGPNWQNVQGHAPGEKGAAND